MELYFKQFRYSTHFFHVNLKVVEKHKSLKRETGTKNIILQYISVYLIRNRKMTEKFKNNVILQEKLTLTNLEIPRNSKLTKICLKHELYSIFYPVASEEL